MPTAHTQPPPTRHRYSAALFLMGFGLAALCVAAFFLLRPPQLTIVVDGEAETVSGRFETVSAALTAAGLTLNPGDLVVPASESVPERNGVIQVQRSSPVAVTTSAGSRTFWTRQRTLAAFVQEAALTIARTDQVYADGRLVSFAQLPTAPLPQELEIGDFVTVTIHDNRRQQVLRTAANTVGGVLVEAGIALYAADDVEPPPGSWLAPDLHIYVRRALPYTIQVDGRTLPTRSYHTNVLDVLAEAGIGLVGRDYTRPGPETVLTPDAVIEVVRVTEDFRIVDQPIPYETVWQPTDQLVLDQRGLLQAGVPGVQRQRVRVTYENGEPVGERTDGTWIAQAPVAEIMGFGTRVVLRTIETPQGPREYYRVVRMRVTAYTAASSGKAPDHPNYGITRSGLPAGTGIVAVDPTVVPWLSDVFVPGYGIGLAGDTGGGVKGRWIDLGYDEDEYVGWSGYVDVYFLTPVPEAINYLLPANLP